MELLEDHLHTWNAFIAVASKAKRSISIATFGIHLPPKKVAAALHQAMLNKIAIKLLVGRHEPYRRDAVSAIVALQDKLKPIADMLPNVKIRVMPCHTKVFMNEEAAVIGGRNLSFSTWPDLSFRFYRTEHPMTFKALHQEFNDQFTSAQKLNDFLKLPPEHWDSEFNRLQEKRVDDILERKVTKETEEMFSLPESTLDKAPADYFDESDRYDL